MDGPFQHVVKYCTILKKKFRPLCLYVRFLQMISWLKCKKEIQVKPNFVTVMQQSLSDSSLNALHMQKKLIITDA